ncbi:MAG: AMP-binding protein [Pseudomonadota bacterium]
MKIVSEYWDEDLELMSPQKLEEIRTEKMQKHLRFAYLNSPFYKRAFNHAGLRPEEIKSLNDYSQRVPFLEHMQMINNQSANPPFGDFLTMGLKDVSRIYCSPGPLMMPFSVGDMDSYINTTANGLYICGARRGDIVDIAVAYQWHLAGTMMDSAFRRLGCAVVPGGSGMTRTHIVIMKNLKVSVMFAFPSFAMHIADTARKMGINPATDLNLRLVILATETCGPNDKAWLAQSFGAEVREMYGGAETGFVAAECQYGNGMHCFTDSILEIVDPATGKVVANGQSGEIVTTDLSRRAMPVVRYRTGDLTEGIIAETCKCGRASPRLQRIVGRTGEVDRVKGVYMIPKLVGAIISGHERLGKYQIVMDRPGFQDRLTIRVETEHVDEMLQLKQALIDNLRTVTQLTAEIDLLPVGTIDESASIVVDNRFLGNDVSPGTHTSH